ncbi:MAG: 3'-5' exonuclease [Bacteroides sp.]|nr:3'-5' exonuclease [Bacteroides sp.]MCM1378724.1 3'-5' exonuclease [Bacteroides sp.]MCM1444997.1 3'-5' exonuclease [Prevotella sp.]
MELHLTKPIIFFDLETTGVNFQEDRIVEISYIKVFPNGSEESKTIRVNPGRPIPAEATAIHHITNEDVANERQFKDIARELARTFQGCDIGGFNSNKFDLPLLQEEFIRAGVDDFDPGRCRLIDVQTIFHKMEQRTLIAAYKFYCGKDLTEAHSANADTRATYEVLKAQLERYPELQNDMDFLANFSTQKRGVDLAGRIVYDDKGREVFNFGKHKGKTVEEVFSTDPNYCSWMQQSDFSADTKRVVLRLYTRFRQNQK